MSIGSSYSYFFNYVANEYPSHKILRCFELQMPVKEVVFSTVDRKCCQIGEVEQFILSGVIKLGKVSAQELNEIYHLGESHIERMLLDFTELGVLQNLNGAYSLSDKGATLLNPDQEEVTIASEHSMIFDVFPMKDRIEKTPAFKDRYKRSLHEYHYPTEFRRGQVSYNPQCMGTSSITKDDLTKCVSLPKDEKRKINFSENILEVKEIKNTYSYSHPLAFVLFLDKKGAEVIKVFDSCNASTLCEIKDAKAVLQNKTYLNYVFSEFFVPNSKELIVDAFKKAKDTAYHIEESNIILVKPAVVKVGGEHWQEHALSGFWYDDRSKLVVCLYPGNEYVAYNILVYKTLINLEIKNNFDELTEETFFKIIEATTKSYNKRLKEYGTVQARKPNRDEVIDHAIKYRFPKLSSDMQDLFDL